MRENKLYYNIGEVAEMFQVKASLIRYWEKEFGSLHKTKNAKGNRKFTKEDIAHFRKIYLLVKEEGYTLEGAKKAMKSRAKKASTNTKAIAIKKLEDIKQRIKGLKP